MGAPPDLNTRFMWSVVEQPGSLPHGQHQAAQQ